MVGLKRPVHFVQIAEVDDRGNIYYFDNQNFWPGLWSHLKNLEVNDPDRLDVKYRGFDYEGVAKEISSPATKYFYVGRMRKASDHPHVNLGRNAQQPLRLENIQGSPTGILEPTYIRQVPGTNCVAVMRTTGSSSWSALEHWINSASGRFANDGDDRTLKLIPVAREDALERLVRAEAAARLEVGLAPTTDPMPEGAGELGRALDQAKEALPDNATINFTASVGRSNPDPSQSQEMVRFLNSAARNPTTKRLKGTIYHPDEETGELIKERIDFFKDKVTTSVKVVDNADITPTDSEIMHALTEAIDFFRDSIGDNYAR